MTAVTTKDEAQPKSAAAPSPFPPIADYGFLSDCHTGALVAPDGAIVEPLDENDVTRAAGRFARARPIGCAALV